MDVNYAAYHVHQAIEKIAKGLLEMNGEDMARRLYRTHDISFLLSRLPSETYVPPIISERTFDIMRWVSEPRYNVNFRLSKDSVYDVYKDTLHWLHSIIPPMEEEFDQEETVKNTSRQKLSHKRKTTNKKKKN